WNWDQMSVASKLSPAHHFANFCGSVQACQTRSNGKRTSLTISTAGWAMITVRSLLMSFSVVIQILRGEEVLQSVQLHVPEATVEGDPFHRLAQRTGQQAAVI